MKTILLTLAVIPLLTGCTSMAKLAKELKGDPAIVVSKLGTVYGTHYLVRIGGTTNDVTVSPDGTVTVGAKK